MKIEEYNLWGSDKNTVFKYGRFYKWYSRSIYIFDIIVVIAVVHFMFNNAVTFGAYVKFMLTIGIICIFALNIPLKEDLWNIYLFYKKYKNMEVKTKYLKISSTDAYSCLYKCNHSRLKRNDELSFYFDFMNKICQKNRKFSSKLMKCLLPFECIEDEANLSIKYIEKNKKLYFIDYVVNEKGGN